MSSFAMPRDVKTAPLASNSRLQFKPLALLGASIAASIWASAFGYQWWTSGRYIESTDDAYIGGNITAISPHVAGFVTEILVGDNQHVEAGQLLMRLDSRDLQAVMNHAGAVLQQHKAALTGLRAKSVLQQSIVRQAAADLDAKAAQSDFAKVDSERYRSLVASSSGSRQDAERAIALAQQARSAVASSQAALDGAKQQLIVLEAQIVEAEAFVAQAEADLETARLNLSYTEIRSPIDGFIGNRAAHVGAYLTEGAYLLAVVPDNGLWIDANFKEDQLQRMAPGQLATIVADVLPDHVFHGHVQSLAPGAGAIFSVIPPENATGNFTKIVQRVPVRIALDAEDATLGKIRPGLSIAASVDTRSKAGVVK
jgi:membrane fusion protein, multidrug efflux system